MASRKQIFILALLALVSSASFAQRTDAGYGWVLDSSKRSVKNLPQQNEFMNNSYPYPSKPRSQWELGVSGGPSFIIGDLRPRLGYGGGLSVRKALGHAFSLRFGWNGAYNYGIDTRLSDGGSMAGFSYANPNPWKTYVQSGKRFVRNYKTASHQLYLNGVLSLNNISYYRGDPKFNFYLFGGYSVNSFDVDVNARNGSQVYNFESINYGQSGSNVISDLKDLLDDSYESNAPFTDANTNVTKRMKDNHLLYHAIDIGAGIAFKVSDKFNIGFEQKLTMPFADEIDGSVSGITRDLWALTQFRLNFNLGSSDKTIQPLWWVNPNNYAYNELNAPKHMKMPPVVLPDADGDGVTDQFDMEPNTPAGCAVDSHGRSLDTDGDGVPDCRDKEPLTQRNCFPVNADGVGNCPEPPCCAELRDKIANMKVAPDCAISSLPSVQFKSGSIALSSTAKSLLSSAAQQLNSNVGCNVRITGYYDASNKRSQQLAWDRVNTVIKYLNEQLGVSESRIIFNLMAGGDPNTVDLAGTTETGPNSIPVPYPNLQKSK